MTWTHTYTETYEERFARLIKEAIEYGESYVKNKSRTHVTAIVNLKEAYKRAEQDIREKGGV